MASEMNLEQSVAVMAKPILEKDTLCKPLSFNNNCGDHFHSVRVLGDLA
jgi:hypothetical protein